MTPFRRALVVVLLRRAPKLHLASGQASASIEIEEGQQAWLGKVDIKVAFYTMGLPAELMQYFGLPSDVRAGGVGITVLDGVAIPPGQLIVPHFSAILMGWTHSLAVCQSVLKGLARQSGGITAEDALQDRRLAPPIDPWIHTEYAENFESYAHRKDLVTEAATAVEGLLKDAGLPPTRLWLHRGRFVRLVLFSHRTDIGSVHTRPLEVAPRSA